MGAAVRTLATTAAVLGLAALAKRRPWLAGGLAVGALVLLRPRRTAGDARRCSEAQLDEALAETFPASDALPLYQVGRGR